jgi:hypothetical protein
MRKLLVLTILLGAFVATNAFGTPAPMDILGGYNPYTTPTFWYLLDYNGIPLEEGDCVCAYWKGPDGLADGPDPANPPEAAGDDVKLVCGGIQYGGFFITVTTWGVGEGHPEPCEEVYVCIFDAPCEQLSTDNFYGMSQQLHVDNFIGETEYALFPGDPGGGHTDTPLPVELMSFDAIARDGEVLLEWKTASESNLLGFYIERDNERISALIEGQGNTATEQTYTYLDRDAENEVTYSYNLITVDLDGVEQVANSEPVSATPMAHMPTVFALHQNYPNPFNPWTDIKYDLPENARVTLKVYNVLGAEVATLVDADQKANFYTVRWDAKDLASGVYFCTINAGEFKAVKKMVLLK